MTKPEKSKPAELTKFKPYYQTILTLIELNLTWFVMSIPIITLFPALGGLYTAIPACNPGKQVGRHKLYDGFKQFWSITLLWGVVVSLGFVVLGVLLWLFLTLEGGFALIAQITAIITIVLWTAFNQFSLPLLLIQKKKHILFAIRNGYVICIRRPLTALKVILTCLLITAVSILWPPLWVFISFALIAQIQTQATLKAVEEIRQEDATRDAIKSHHESKDHSEDTGLQQ
ncbi:MAG: hypothetical protein ACK2TV_02045 [Anaerolineales bacterium]